MRAFGNFLKLVLRILTAFGWLIPFVLLAWWQELLLNEQAGVGLELGLRHAETVGLAAIGLGVYFWSLMSRKYAFAPVTLAVGFILMSLVSVVVAVYFPPQTTDIGLRVAGLLYFAFGIVGNLVAKK